MLQKANDLAVFDGVFQRCLSGGPSGLGRLPDGRYAVIVEKVELAHTKTTGKVKLTWKLRVLGPHCADRLMWSNVVITDRSIPFIIKDLEICGIILERFSDLASELHRLRGVRLEVSKRTSSDFENVYINRRLGSEAEPVQICQEAGDAING